MGRPLSCGERWVVDGVEDGVVKKWGGQKMEWSKNGVVKKWGQDDGGRTMGAGRWGQDDGGKTMGAERWGQNDG
ncbi:hypothetical protein CKO51_23785, partial [Rhodopirellula sp. SM50]